MYREVKGDSAIPADDWMKAMLPLVESGHILKICPSGVSMVPFITGGRDQACLRSASGVVLRRGDIVLYRRGGGDHILHRIQRVRDGGYYMLGDSQSWIEGPVRREDILAVVDSFIRKGREYRCDGRAYRALAELWLLLRPLRPFIFSVRSLLGVGIP